VKITVIICTFNRCATLAKALDSIASQVLPESVGWEVLVVDNNSTDQTREIIEDFCRRYPNRFRHIFEPQQGLSRARNAGIREAQGDIVAFTDDDVIAEPCWLQNLTGSLHDRNWAGAGGRILPPPDFDPPEWLTPCGALLPLFDLGERACDMNEPPYGANMAFRKSMFEKYGNFRVDLGRCGGSLLMGEDVEFGNRLLSAGERLYYEPSAVVEHPVAKDRLSKKHLRAWWMDFGRTRIIERGVRPPILGIPRRFLSLVSLVFRLLPLRVIRWLFSLNMQRRFYNECQIWLTFGEIAQNKHLLFGKAEIRSTGSTGI
jgi:glucosyl-dolichyl phosphate glucuronosyltransferase